MRQCEEVKNVTYELIIIIISYGYLRTIIFRLRIETKYMCIIFYYVVIHKIFNFKPFKIKNISRYKCKTIFGFRKIQYVFWNIFFEEHSK